MDRPPGVRLSSRDWRLVALWLVIAGAAAAIVARHFDDAFPQASIEFRYDRKTSRAIAERFAQRAGNDLRAMRHTARFDSDELARIFLERNLGLKAANAAVRRDVRVWYWHHRWFVPLQEEEISVDVAPTGEIVGYSRRIPEERTLPDAASMAPPLDQLRALGVDPAGLTLVGTSERRLAGRTQRIFTFESKSVRPAGAAYRHTVTFDGTVLTGYAQRLKLPDAWVRSYRELRSKNNAAGSVDLVFNAILLAGAVTVFAIRLRRGDVQLRFVLGIGIATVLLSGGAALNSLPAQLAWYDTTTSYPAFLTQIGVMSVLQSIGMAMLLIVMCGAGEVLYRERLPQQLSIPRLWTRRSFRSKRVFLSLILGYALVPAFMAYQVVFYLTATRFGAWAPAEVPYDEMLNSALPWMAVLFAGFFPAFSEEFLSRAFAIPFLQRFVRSRFAAIVLAAFIWGFGHATYPNQPFWIRGVEVGLVGIVAGLLMERFGLLPLLVWHYTIDAVYTATLLLASGNRYYIVSTAVAALLFLLPLVISIVLYLRNGGFEPDEELNNAMTPLAPVRPPVERPTAAPLPPPAALTPRAVVLCVVAVAAALALIAFRPAGPDDAADYRISADQAKAAAKARLEEIAPGGSGRFERVIATPVEGFRSWDPESPREDGGNPGDFDAIAATYLLRHGMPMEQLVATFRERVHAADWSVRFFTPERKEELFVDVDPRSGRAVGFHRYVDERAPGRSIEKQAATEIASRALPRWGFAPEAFTLREALVFQQPARRDWLLHFEERRPLAGEAHRRVSVRIAGDRVTQLAATVHIPESVYHEESKQTLFNVVLLVLKIAGAVALLAFVIGGLVIATRHGLPWRRPLRWAAPFAIVPLASFFFHWERTLFGYNTSVAWETFRVGLITSLVRDVGLQAGLVFLALAGLEALLPWSSAVVSRQGLGRFGRSAAVAALTALALLAILSLLPSYFAAWLPARAQVELSVPAEVAIAWPAVPVLLRAALAAVIVSASAAMYATSIRRHAAAISIAAFFFAALDPSASAAQAPLAVANALLFALLAWVIGRHVLGTNPLAWPLTVFLAIVLNSAAALAQNGRPDLLANAAVLGVIAVAVLIRCVVPGSASSRASHVELQGSREE